MRLQPQFEALALSQHRIEQNFGARLGIGFADEALAMAAELALTKLHTIGIGVGLRRIRRRQRKRLVAELLGCLAEDHARFGDGQRFLRKLVLAWCLERISALLHLATQISRLAGNAEQLFELIVIGLHLGIADAPILDRHFSWNGFLSIPVLKVGAQNGVRFAPAPSLPVPVIGRTAHSLARLEGLKTPYRQRRFAAIMAKRVGLDGPILKEITMHVPAKFVALRWQACCGSVGTVDSAFKDDDIDVLGCQLASSQCRRESAADENDGAMFQACSHDFFP